MKALTWHGKRDVRIDTVPDPTIRKPTDAVIRITTTGLCGSDLHLYEVLGAFLSEGDILGHEPMGIVEEVGDEVTTLKRGDRVVIPFNIACGHCFMCERGLQSQCETTQNHKQGTGGSLFGYTKLYGSVPGGQAELLRVPLADYNHITVPEEAEGMPDDRFFYLSDVLATAWQAVAYADIPEGGTLGVIGLGPIGDMTTRVAMHKGHRAIAVDIVPERIERARANGVEVIDGREQKDVADAMREMTDGRGPDSVVDAVGMEAHGAPVSKLAQEMVTFLPSAVAAPLMKHAGVDRLSALHLAIDAVRRGGTISVSGVYGGQTDPMPMLTMFDKQVQIRMGQANVLRWVPEIMPLLTRADDPLGVDTFATHRLPLSEAPRAYEMFQKKEDGAVKVLFQP
jgi:threonine dehydrogenase-like Zn-dependent dehydrogenase